MVKFFVSRDDNSIVIQTHVSDRSKIVERLLITRLQDTSKKVFDFDSKYSIKINENPWSPKGDKLVFSLQNGDHKSVCVLSLLNGLKEILSEGSITSWSPVDNSVVFVKGKIILLYNLDNRKLSQIYKFRRNEVVKNIHWSPDGKGFLISYYKIPLGIDIFSSYHKVFIHSDLSVSNPKNLFMQNDEFSWR